MPLDAAILILYVVWVIQHARSVISLRCKTITFTESMVDPSTKTINQSRSSSLRSNSSTMLRNITITFAVLSAIVAQILMHKAVNDHEPSSWIEQELHDSGGRVHMVTCCGYCGYVCSSLRYFRWKVIELTDAPHDPMSLRYSPCPFVRYYAHELTWVSHSQRSQWRLVLKESWKMWYSSSILLEKRNVLQPRSFTTEPHLTRPSRSWQGPEL